MNIAVAIKRMLPFAAPSTGDGEDGAVVPRAEAELSGAGDGAMQVSHWLRFRAWWDGMTIAEAIADEARRAGERAAKAAAAAEEDAADGAPMLGLVAAAPEAEVPFDPAQWSPARIAINEMLFGTGEILPGGVARTIDLIGSFGLGQDVNVLQIGAGLGGPARAIALEYQGWVTGYESHAELAAAAMSPERVNGNVNDSGAGMKKSKIKVKLADKARIEHADLETLEVKARVYDCAFARETLHLIADKPRLLRVIADGLKLQGALMIADYFVAEGHGGDDFRDWAAEGDGRFHPWTLAEAKAMLGKAGFDLRVVKDMTAEHRADILRSFGGFVLDHKKGRFSPQLIQPLLYLTECWAHRIALIDAGVIEVHKLQAFKLAELKK